MPANGIPSGFAGCRWCGRVQPRAGADDERRRSRPGAWRPPHRRSVSGAMPVPSGSIALAIRDGVLGPLLFCHAGCSTRDVIDELRGRGLWDASRSSAATSSPPRKIETDEAGERQRRIEAARRIWTRTRSARHACREIPERSRPRSAARSLRSRAAVSSGLSVGQGRKGARTGRRLPADQRAGRRRSARRDSAHRPQRRRQQDRQEDARPGRRLRHQARRRRDGEPRPRHLAEGLETGAARCAPPAGVRCGALGAAGFDRTPSRCSPASRR